MVSEKDLQQNITELIKNEDFFDAIINKDALDEALKSYYDPNIIPHLSIDDLLKKKYSKAAKSVLESLPGCEIVTGDIIKDISMTADEKLFPDIILFNYETAQIVIIENKMHSKAGREAITEIYGYINEVRNHLPFASNCDISVIIVSPVFNTLLDHSISSNILSSNIDLLCLAPIDGQKLKFDIHFPKSWNDIGQDNLPDNSLVSYSWSLKIKDPELEVNYLSILNLARELIVNNANRIASSGFVLIWENAFFKSSEAEFVITNYVINSFSFLPNADKSGFAYRENVLAAQLKDYSNDNGGLVHPASLFRIMEEASVYLKEYFNISVESATDWNIDYNYELNRYQRNPLLFDSWGFVGEYVRFFYFHPAVRKFYFDKNQDNINGHLNPLIGLQIINIITKNTIFKNGHFQGIDLFNFGKQLSYYNQNCSFIKASDNEAKRHATLFWSNLELLQSLKEVEFYDINTLGANDQINLQLQLALNPNNICDDFRTNNDTFAHNFILKYLNEDHNIVYKKIFDFGYCYGIYFSNFWLSQIAIEDLQQIEKDLGKFVRDYLSFIAKSVKDKERYLNSNEIQFFSTYLKTDFGNDTFEKINAKLTAAPDKFLAKIFPVFLELFQGTIGTPIKELAEINIPESVDWSWMKESLDKQFKKGNRLGCVNIEPNGNFSVSQVPKECHLPPLSSNSEVYLKTYGNTSMQIVRKVLWKDIESGKAFIS